MFQKQFNHAKLGLCIEPRGPLLIKSGLESSDPTRPSMEFVRTRHPEYGDSVYLPGTSLKGALRHHAERSLLGLGVYACNPLDVRNSNCHRAGNTGDTASSYRGQCAVCRTFGSLKVAGRCGIQDAYPWPRSDDGTIRESGANATETRFQVGIERHSGGAKGGALFDLETVVSGTFYTEIRLRNFQLWQLGLVQALVCDLDSGLTPVGFGKSRGLGQVAARVTSFEMEMLGSQAALGQGRAIQGVGSLCSADEQRRYGLFAESPFELEGTTAAALQRTWRGARLSLEGEEARTLLDRLRDTPLPAMIEAASSRRAQRS